MLTAFDMIQVLFERFVIDDCEGTTAYGATCIDYEIILNEETTDWVELDDQVFDFTCEGATLVRKTEIHENYVDGRIWELSSEDGNTLTILLEE